MRKAFKTYCEDSTSVDKRVSSSLEWAIGKPTPDKSHNDEDTGRSKRDYDGMRQQEPTLLVGPDSLLLICGTVKVVPGTG